MAEMFGIVLEGVKDGGQPKISALYERIDKTYQRGTVENAVDLSLRHIVETFDEPLRETRISTAPHFLMLFAATAHVLVGIPKGDLDSLPPRGKLAEPDVAVQGLYEVGEVLDSDEPPRAARPFWTASTSSTQRIASRQVRFPVYHAAVTGKATGL